MKIKRIALLSALSVTMLTGCELKEELWPESEQTDYGKVELSVAAREPESMTRASVPTGDFEVDIVGTSEGVTDESLHYNAAKEIPSEITLPIGTYNVTAHSSGDIAPTMDAPYYAGTKDLTISPDRTNTVTVSCTMKNSRIQMIYTDDFKANFKTWTITVDCGEDIALTYTEQDLNPKDKFVHFPEEKNIQIITVNITAVTKDNQTIHDFRKFQKSYATEGYDNVSPYFGGGDAIKINMGAAESTDGFLTGVTINTNITFANYSENVDIPVYEPDNSPVISDNDTGYLGNGVDISSTTAPSVVLNVTSAEGIRDFYVKVASTSDAYTQALGMFGLAAMTTGNGMDLTTTPNSVFGTHPVDGATSYNLSFSGLMNAMQTNKGTHTYTITVVDTKGQRTTANLIITSGNSTGENTGGETTNDDPEVTCTDGAGTDFFTTGVTYSIEDGDWPTATNAVINTPNGLQKLLVTIVGGNGGFEAAATDLAFDNKNLVGDNELFEMLNGLGVEITAPVSGASTYTFPIHAFYTMMNLYGPTVDADQIEYDPDGVDYHLFKLTVIDQQGKSVGPKEIRVTIRQ